MKYKRKQMVCDEEKPDELELLKWFESKGHGFFSHQTKLYWLEEMRKEKEDKQYEGISTTSRRSNGKVPRIL